MTEPESRDVASSSSKKAAAEAKANAKDSAKASANANAEANAKAKPELRFGEKWQYAAAPESTDHFEIRSRYGLFVDGEFREPLSGESFATINPATEAPLSEVAFAHEQDVDAAVRAARRAYEEVW